MLYKMITKARDYWFASNDCTVKELVNYMYDKGEMRDSQIDAIKTYLFLKIKCQNKPLYQCMIDGLFNSEIDISQLELKDSTKNILRTQKEALALYEYSCLTDDNGRKVFESLNNEIKKNAENINFKYAIKQMFKNQFYVNYLFSLPMGAGKTFLMASFIYLDLYFALREPTNKSFAHNFIIFAPSGLKSSVIPSLKTIKNFDATWILPESAVKQIKNVLKFEVLEESKTANKSNKIKNPNVQKVATYQPFDSLIGLVLVTNAEKVILDNVKINKTTGQISFEELNKEEEAMNELKKFIAYIPNLQVIVDEVHHLVDEEVKLNGVVDYWYRNGNMNSMIGFSGTPYYNKRESVNFSNNLTYKTIQIPYIVNFFPLIKAVETFLKKPKINIVTDRDSMLIIEKGLTDFFETYKDTIYSNGTCAKIAIYCGRIAKLREMIYPKCVEIVTKYGLNPDEVILCYHGADKEKKYVCSKQEELEFLSLDSSVSKKKIVLLAQIGKEGWNCKSLTGVILSQEGDCPNNMVLQTSCRCLRQVDKNSTTETAIIWLNDYNAKILNSQLDEQQHTSIEEINNVQRIEKIDIRRYDRTKRLKLPYIDFYQFKVEYETVEVEDNVSVVEKLKNIKPEKQIITTVQQDIKGQTLTHIEFENDYGDEITTYSKWLLAICKESFNLLQISDLHKYDDILNNIFATITICKDELHYFNKLYDISKINSEIRKAFQKSYTFKTNEEVLFETKSLLNKDNFTEIIKTSDASKFYPLKNVVDRIIQSDKRGSFYTPEQEKEIKKLKSVGMEKYIDKEFFLPPEIKLKDKTFQYLPYNFLQSDFEQKTFAKILMLPAFQNNNLEVYYNGDRALTEFKIKCYKLRGSSWYYIGKYTPDFLVLNRKNDKIDKVLIIETKGSGFAEDKTFNDKKEFVKTKFLEINKNRFDYFYMQDNENENDVLKRLNDKINNLFKEKNKNGD